MVYCGQPSRGCQMCRQRRIKCDEGRPTCQRCAKSRRVCPGYRDEFDLVLRNETNATERRARKSTTKINTLTAQRSLGASEASDASEPYDGDIIPLSAGSTTTTVSIHNALAIPLETRAKNFFLANFVLLPQAGTNRAWLDYVVPLIKSESVGSPLQRAFSAVALAALGNRPNAKQLLLPAYHEYGRAMRQVNDALRDPDRQRDDSTLASVLLLGLYEIITCRRTDVLAWGSHIQGAVTLVKQRGKKALKTQVGRSLFYAVRTAMIVNCLASSKPIDGGIDWWMIDAVKDPYAHRITRLHLLVTELRAEVNDIMTICAKTPENTVAIQVLVQKAHRMDREYYDFINHVPDEWKYKTVHWSDGSSGDIADADVCPGKVDLYTDIFIVTVWNNLRTSRLLLHGLIVRCAAWLCAPVDYRTTPEYASASRIGSELITDLCASIPFSLGWQLAINGSRSETRMSSNYACGDDGYDSSKGLGGYMAMWPLFSGSCSDFATDVQRRWMLGRLKYIADYMGISQARLFASYQLRLPSMIVKRDGFALAQIAAVKAANSSAKTRGSSQGSISLSQRPILSADTSASNYTTDAVNISAQFVPVDFRSQTARNNSSSTSPKQSAHDSNRASSYHDISPTSYQQPPPQGSHASAQWTASPGSTTSDSPQTHHQATYPTTMQQPFLAASLSPIAPPHHRSHLLPQTASQRSSYSPGQYTMQSPLSSTTMTNQREVWAAIEAERAQREVEIALREQRIRDLEEARRKEVLEKDKEDLVVQAAGGDGAEDQMRAIMRGYLAVDKVGAGT